MAFEAKEEKQMGVYEEQYKATMVDQELDDAKVVEGEWHAMSKAPYYHLIYNLRALDSNCLFSSVMLCYEWLRM